MFNDYSAPFAVIARKPEHLAGTLELDLWASPAKVGDPASMSAATQLILDVQAALIDRPEMFYLETAPSAPEPNVNSSHITHKIYLTPRFADPRDLAERIDKFNLLFGILAGAGAHGLSQLALVDWALAPLHHDWAAAYHRQARSQRQYGYGKIYPWMLDLARDHYEQIRAARVPLLGPWLNGTYPVTDPPTFRLLHAELPTEAGYIGLQLARGQLGTLMAKPDSELHQIAEQLKFHKLLRSAGVELNGDLKYFRTSAFLKTINYAEQMELR